MRARRVRSGIGASLRTGDRADGYKKGKQDAETRPALVQIPEGGGFALLCWESALAPSLRTYRHRSETPYKQLMSHETQAQSRV